MSLILYEKLLGIWIAIFRGVTGTGDTPVIFVVDQATSMGSLGAMRLRSSSACSVVEIIDSLKGDSGVGMPTMP